MQKQFAAAFDTYLAILRQIKVRTDQALGRNTPDWRLRYGCPPCGYKVEGEPSLSPARLHAMDGNFSLKRVDGSGLADERVFSSDYHISPEQVDEFKDDVTHRAHTQLTSVVAPCPAENWAAASSVSEETIKVFEQTGIFLSACRHGIVETFAEIRRSGEL